MASRGLVAALSRRHLLDLPPALLIHCAGIHARSLPTDPVPVSPIETRILLTSSPDRHPAFTRSFNPSQIVVADGATAACVPPTPPPISPVRLPGVLARFAFGSHKPVTTAPLAAQSPAIAAAFAVGVSVPFASRDSISTNSRITKQQLRQIRRFHQLSQSQQQDPHQQPSAEPVPFSLDSRVTSGLDNAAVVYQGPFSSPLRNVKILSLSTCLLSLTLGPIVTFYSTGALSAAGGAAAAGVTGAAGAVGAAGGAGAAGATAAAAAPGAAAANVLLKGSIAGTLALFSTATTATLHWVGSPYVRSIRFRRGAPSMQVETLSWMGTPMRSTVNLRDIAAAPQGNRPLQPTFVAGGKEYYVDLDLVECSELRRRLERVAAGHGADSVGSHD